MPFLDGVTLNVHTAVFACAVALGAALLFAQDFNSAALIPESARRVGGGGTECGKQVMAEAGEPIL